MWATVLEIVLALALILSIWIALRLRHAAVRRRREERQLARLAVRPPISRRAYRVIGGHAGPEEPH